MIRNELVKRLLARSPQLFEKDVEKATKQLINGLSDALVRGSRVEIRGFGTFSLKHYDERSAINPRTGDRVALNSRSLPYFRVSRKVHNELNKEV